MLEVEDRCKQRPPAVFMDHDTPGPRSSEVNADRDEGGGERQQRRANQQPAKRYHSCRDSPGRAINFQIAPATRLPPIITASQARPMVMVCSGSAPNGAS